MSDTILITGHRLVISRDILFDLEEPMACPGIEGGAEDRK